MELENVGGGKKKRTVKSARASSPKTGRKPVRASSPGPTKSRPTSRPKKHEGGDINALLAALALTGSAVYAKNSINKSPLVLPNISLRTSKKKRGGGPNGPDDPDDPNDTNVPNQSQWIVGPDEEDENANANANQSDAIQPVSPEITTDPSLNVPPSGGSKSKTKGKPKPKAAAAPKKKVVTKGGNYNEQLKDLIAALRNKL